LQAAPLLRVTAWAIPAGALDMAATSLCMALGVSKIMVRTAILNLVLFIPASLVVRHFGGGLLGLAICWSASRYLLGLSILFGVIRRLNEGMSYILKPLMGLIGSTIAASAAMMAVRVIAGQFSFLIQLVAAGLVGVIVYFGSVWLLEPNTMRDSLNMARGRENTGADGPANILPESNQPASAGE
jgi:hypothetical protein